MADELGLWKDEGDTRWNREAFNRYVNASGFTSELQMRAVFNALTISNIAMDFLDTAAGKIVMSSTTRKVKDNLSKIISLSRDGFDANIDGIRQAATEINLAYDFMMGILDIIARGDDYEKQREKAV
jgi:hypothetical protein